MKNLLLPAFVLCFLQTASAQECGTGRYTNYNFFPAVDSVVDVQYGHNTGVDGTDQALFMNLYMPAGDILSARPVVMVAFGGSFVTGTREDVVPFCMDLARLGYVAVAMDYRVGFFFPNTTTTMHAVMRCVHDLRGCARYLRKTVAEDGNPYHIDPQRFIVGGVSAGAIGALQMTYLDQPSELPPELVADSATLGGMEGTSGPLGYSSDVIACFSLSGAIMDTSWIQPGDQPLCGIHETGDPTVPCYTAEAYALGIPTGITVSGGHDIHLRMSHIGVPDCYLEYNANQHVGYLNYDPVYSIDVVVQFLARVVCGQAPGCPNVLLTVQEADKQDGMFKPYPDPTTGLFSINMPAKGIVSIIDPQGRAVMRRALRAGKNAVDVSGLADGLYVLRTDGGRSVRLVKAR